MEKVLVVYFSAGGRPKGIAEYISEEIRANLFEITPVVPYSAGYLNYRSSNSRTLLKSAERTEVEFVSTTVEVWDSYDIVFFGYTIGGLTKHGL